MHDGKLAYCSVVQENMFRSIGGANIYHIRKANMPAYETLFFKVLRTTLT